MTKIIFFEKDWKYGFDNRVGYLEKLSLEQIEEATRGYIDRDVTYVLGTKDTCNCALSDNDPWCFDEQGECVDHSLDKRYTCLILVITLVLDIAILTLLITVIYIN